jgi:RNA polymerase sigma-70 factor (ECF subfamily)
MIDSVSTIEHDVIKHIPIIERFALRLCSNNPDAEDLVQDTLMKALSNLDKFETGTNLKSWLFTIMRNTFLSRIQKRKREVVGISDVGSIAPRTLPTQEWTMRGHEFERALGELTFLHRQAATTVLIEGRSYEDAAQLFNCAVGTVKSRVSRARNSLANRLGDPTKMAAQI